MKINYDNRRAIESLFGGNLYSTAELLQVKKLTDMPKEVIEQIKLVSLPESKEGITPGQPFGSYVNRIADYFGDIDVIQLFSGCCNLKEVGIKAAKAIQEMVFQISKKKDHYFSEFKAGIDKPYLFDYGTMFEGVYRTSPILLSKSELLFKDKLLSPKEIKIIREIVTDSNALRANGDDYDVITNLFRDRYLLRWTEKEIMQGHKQTPTGKKMLSEAVLDQSAVKIDMIMINPGGKFIEVTNFMALGMSNKKNEFVPINVDPADLTPEALPVEIEKLYYSNFHYKPFKIVKRAFAFLKFLSLNWGKKTFDNSKYVMRNITKESVDYLLDGYVQVLQSTVNILYTVNSELDAIKLVLERADITQAQMVKLHERIDQRLDMLKDPLANVLEIDQTNLDFLMVMVDKCRQEQEHSKKIECIQLLMKTFKEIINFWTIAYFDQLGLNPPPAIVLPLEMTYGPVIREPYSNPVNPLKAALEGKKGGSIASTIFQKAANAYRRNYCDGKSRPLHKGEYHLGCHNFTGPGTRVDLASVRNYPPYNKIDECSRGHDFDYMHAVELPDGERQKAIIDADKKVIQCYDKYPDVSGYSISKMGINSKMKFDQVLPAVSRSVFKKISAAPTPTQAKKGSGMQPISGVDVLFEGGKKVWVM